VRKGGGGEDKGKEQQKRHEVSLDAQLKRKEISGRSAKKRKAIARFT